MVVTRSQFRSLHQRLLNVLVPPLGDGHSNLLIGGAFLRTAESAIADGLLDRLGGETSPISRAEVSAVMGPTHLLLRPPEAQPPPCLSVGSLSPVGGACAPPSSQCCSARLWGNPTDEPVIGWMPAASLHFRDPDGNMLELLSMLPESPNQNWELSVGVVGTKCTYPFRSSW
jgi:hypothetical protein